MSSPGNVGGGGSAREGTRVVLKEITASLQNSPPIYPARRKSGNDSTAPKTAEHEVKVRFTREFADVESVARTAPESLSSASSFHSLNSTLSTKSSSGICPDLALNTLDDVANTSYVNTDISGVDDLILACANIRLEGERSFEGFQASQDLSQDQSFASATDETPFHVNSFNDDLPDNVTNETQLIETNPPLHQTTYVSLNQTHTFESIEDSQSVILSYPSTDEYVSRAEELIEESVLLRTDDNIPPIGDSLPIGNVDDDAIHDEVITINEEQTIENDRNTEITLPLETLKLHPTQFSVPSISPEAQHEESPLLASTSLSLENIDNKKKEDSIDHVPELAQELTQELTQQFTQELTQELADSIPNASSFFADQALSPELIASNTIVQADKSKIIEEENLPRSDTIAISEHNEDSTSQILRDNLESNVDTHTLEIGDSVVSNETQTLLAKEDITVRRDEIQVVEGQYNSPEDVIIETEQIIVQNVASTDTVKEKEIHILEEDLDRTLTLEEVNTNLIFASEEDQYSEFKPQRQSTILSLVKEQPDFEGLRFTSEEITTNDLLDTSPADAEQADQFVSATSEIFQDPSTFDFLLARSNSKHSNRLRTESLYVKFDPLVSNTSMLPQGNVQSMNEEQDAREETPLPDVGTPKHNSAIAAIDRLLFCNLPSGTLQKLEETPKKIEQPVQEPKSDVSLITDTDMAKELELVRATILQLEEKLEKQKNEHEAELERRKTSFQEKINKLQTQMAQEMKIKAQMTLVVEEYEKSISTLLTERERDRTNFEQEKTKLEEELQAANHHLTNTEAAFNDVHQKYERLKGVVSVYKNNESVLKESIQENVDTIKTLETRYDQLKDHAMDQLEKANLELDGIRKQNEAETVKLHAMIRKAELKSNSLAELVEQKTKENKELTKILDEVIARVGHGNQE